MPLIEFVGRQFIEGFVKRGKCVLSFKFFPKNCFKFKSFFFSGQIYALSIDRRIDVDDVVAITPCGKLRLSVEKTVYQSLGLEGKVSHFSTKTEERYSKLNTANKKKTENLGSILKFQNSINILFCC